MSCTNCSGTSSFSIPTTQSIKPCSNGMFDARCIVYTGPSLSCINVDTNTCLQDIIQSINSKVCQAVGDYTQYNFNCLSSEFIITNEGEFVDAITQYVCNLSTRIDNLEITVQNNYNDLTTQINTIKNPGLTSPCPTIVIYDETSSLDQILTAQSTAICNLNSSLSLTGVDWDKCYTPTSTPTNIIEGFNELLNQICLTKQSTGGGGVLPTFDNTGTCLSSPTASDSLVDTIIKIRTRLCQTPTFNASNLTPSACVQFSGASTLEEVIDAQNNQITQISQQSIRQISTDFTITPVDSTQPCLGMKLGLNSSVQDRRVASNAADTSPGTLQDKLQQGTNITLDYATTPGKVIINATGGSQTDEKVKATSTDPTAGYLNTKIVGDTSDPVIQTSIIPQTTNVKVTSSINMEELVKAILEVLEDPTTDPTIKQRFCAIVSSCPVACAAPTNASVSFQTS